MDSKIVVITGANSGIGKALVTLFLKDRSHVVMVCRNKAKGESVMKEMLKTHPGAQISLLIADLSILTEVVALSKELTLQFPVIDVLINNAGLILTQRTLSPDGNEKQFTVNYLAPTLLSHLLVPSLKKSADPRIVSVSSGAHKAGKLYFNDVSLEDNYRTFRAYCQSKLALTTMVSILGEDYKKLGININCYHPGAVGTNFGVNRKTGAGKQLLKLLSIFFITPEAGAKTGHYLATNASVREINGAYFYKEQPASVAKSVHHQGLRDQLSVLTMNALKAYGYGPLYFSSQK